MTFFSMIAKALAALVVLLPAMAIAEGQIVYVGQPDDPYYEPQKAYTGLSLRDRSRPLPGAEVAMRSARVLERALGIEFTLEERLTDDPAAAVNEAAAGGAAAVLLDLPPDAMTAVLADHGTGGTTLFNIRDAHPAWRGADCAPAMLHTMPSQEMLADALAQHLRAQGWDRVLLLTGTALEDEEEAQSVRRAIAKFGLRLADERRFELSNDPRQRDLNNIRLLTGGMRHDVIWLIDTVGEFGRYVPFATQDPVPVVGSEGLRPLAWHWTLERYGAPQLNQRFQRLAGRDMSDGDWAAWAAARAVIEAAQRTGGADPAAISAYLRGEDLSLDLYKGVAGSFRAWDGQLRQPIVLATHNAVIALPPLDGFEHRTDTLDTLGLDEPESACDRD
ncbi:type 1 periplasmic-binding domain-containing protein [Halovulum sp. GXIMD14794]